MLILQGVSFRDKALSECCKILILYGGTERTLKLHYRGVGFFMAGPTSPALSKFCTQVQRPSKFYHSKFGRPIQICDEAQGRSRKETPVENVEENHKRSGNCVDFYGRVC